MNRGRTKCKPTPGITARKRTPKATTQKDKAYERIYRDLITFQLKPGERISERVLIEKYDIGKAAVRTVLLRLVQDGLITNEGRNGHEVIPITLESIRNVIELRLILEPAAAELAAGRVDVARLKALNGHTSADPSESHWHISSKYLEANRDFHVAIAEYSGNRQLAVWIKHLHNLSFRTFHLLERSGSIITGGQEGHDLIVEALEAGNGTAAARITREHIEAAREQTLSAIINLPELQQVRITPHQSRTMT